MCDSLHHSLLFFFYTDPWPMTQTPTVETSAWWNLLSDWTGLNKPSRTFLEKHCQSEAEPLSSLCSHCPSYWSVFHSSLSELIYDVVCGYRLWDNRCHSSRFTYWTRKIQFNLFSIHCVFLFRLFFCWSLSFLSKVSSRSNNLHLDSVGNLGWRICCLYSTQ